MLKNLPSGKEAKQMGNMAVTGSASKSWCHSISCPCCPPLKAAAALCRFYPPETAVDIQNFLPDAVGE